MLPRAIVDPVAEREGAEKNEAAKNQDGIKLESRKYLAGGYEYNDAHQKESRSPHQPPPHHQLGRGGSQPARRTLIGHAIGPAIETPCHTGSGSAANAASNCSLPLSSRISNTTANPFPGSTLHTVQFNRMTGSSNKRAENVAPTHSGGASTTNKPRGPTSLTTPCQRSGTPLDFQLSSTFSAEKLAALVTVDLVRRRLRSHFFASRRMLSVVWQSVKIRFA